MSLVSTTEARDNLEVEVRKTRRVTVLSGETLTRGMLVAYDGVATAKVVQYADGDTPYTVIAEDVDASGGDVVALAYRDADLKASEVDFNDGTDTAALRDILDTKNIFLMD